MTDASMANDAWLRHLADEFEAGKAVRPCPKALRRTADVLTAYHRETPKLRDALEMLISAAVGMPFSHDNLCQATLDHAVAEARKTLEGKGADDA